MKKFQAPTSQINSPFLQTKHN